MRSAEGVRALALSAILVGAAVGLAAPSEARPDPERTTESPAALPRDVARHGCENPVVSATEVEAARQRLVGEVIALDEEAGRLVLATRGGPVALAVSRDTLSDLDVGDVIVVELVPELDAERSRADCK